MGAALQGEIDATQTALRASRDSGRVQQRKVRQLQKDRQKYVKEHKVSQWDVQKGGNPWHPQSRQTNEFNNDVRLDAVGGAYREPVRTVHGCVTAEEQLIHPDFKRVLKTPDGTKHWSMQETGRNEAFGSTASLRRSCLEEGTYRFDQTGGLPSRYLDGKHDKLKMLEKHAVSIESGQRGRQRAAFISRTRFFVAPDRVDIDRDGMVSQRFPQAHPPVRPWREEFEKRANATWAYPNQTLRILSKPSPTITAETPYYNSREVTAAWQPQRALTDRARFAVRSASGSRRSRSARVTMPDNDVLRLSTRALTLSLAAEAVPAQFSTVTSRHACAPDTSSDTRRFLRDELVDVRRDDSELKFIGARQSTVVGRMPLHEMRK